MRFAVGGLSMGQVAEAVVRAGFAVFPLTPGGKLPAISKRKGGSGVKDATRDLDQVREWWRQIPQANVGVSLAGWIVVDVDPRSNGFAGLAVLEADIGATAEGLKSLTGVWRDEAGDEYRGCHIWYRLPDGVATLKQTGSLAEGVDFKTGAGSYVVGPGSHHASGVRYEWADDGASEAGVAPGWLIDRVLRHPSGRGASAPNATGAGEVAARGQSGARATGLAGLIQMGLDGRVQGRNQWVTGVVGHLAKLVPYDDGVRAVSELVWRLAAEQPAGHEYTRDEYEKTVASILATERSAWPTGRPSEHNGWLISSGTGTILTMCAVKDTEETEQRVWSNFDIRALGLAVDEQDQQTWHVEITVGVKSSVGVLPGSVLGAERDLARWLAGFGAFITGAPGDTWRHVAPQKRIGLYLQAQGAIEAKTLSALGWDRRAGGFLCHEGVITDSGLTEATGLQPATILRNWAPARYGFEGSWEEAAGVLKEVLTFHDTTVAAVFGAWWAACWLKPQIFDWAGVFPIMAIEAPSETGKSNGLFALMVQMNGQTQGGGEMTMADLRDRMSANHSGIVWLDDLSDLEHVYEILRQSAVEGSRSKKGADRHTSEVRRMVAPVVLSAEGLGGIRAEKAMLDRVVLLGVGSPVGRRSTKGDYPQYDDIKTLRDRYNRDLSQLAGWYVQKALYWWELEGAGTFKELRMGDGRHGWKIATLRLGGRLLSWMTGESGWAERVDEWCMGQSAAGLNDRLVLDIIPQALNASNLMGGLPRTPSGRPMVYVDEHRAVWFSISSLADWWRREHRFDKRALQLGSAEALQQQAERLECGPGQRKRTYKPRSGEERKIEMARYHRLPDEAATIALDRAGWSEERFEEGQLNV